jgi:hypothetical protein
MGKAERGRPKMSDVLRQAIRDSGLTLYRVAKDSGVDYATLYRFMKGERAIHMRAADKLVDYLGLQLTRRE